MAVLGGSEEQARLLEDALGVVRQQSSMMRRCLETPGKLMDALKCCSTLVSELRTSSLGPKQYYELYMSVFDALRHLSVYLRDSHPVNHLADLYELVQYAGNIIPRLYLMITVGTVYMGIPDAPVKEIMKDMMEMSRGVQHPMRGLFLRYYLSGQARDHMPMSIPKQKRSENEDGEQANEKDTQEDDEVDADGPQGSLQDSISFTLTNFVEMNKLWVRLQHLGHSREREQRYKERQELQLLVGSNLVRLSQLVDLDTYKNAILAPLLEQVVQCRDVLAQEYLLEVITQVFPDEFHLNTLDQLLAATARLNPHVNVKNIVIGLMDRLSTFASKDQDSRTATERASQESDAVTKLLENLKVSEEEKTSKKEAKGAVKKDDEAEQSKPEQDDTETRRTSVSDTATLTNGEPKSPGLPKDIKLFEIFHEQVMNLADAQRLPIQDITALLVSLVNLALYVTVLYHLLY